LIYRSCFERFEAFNKVSIHFTLKVEATRPSETLVSYYRHYTVS